MKRLDILIIKCLSAVTIHTIHSFSVLSINHLIFTQKIRPGIFFLIGLYHFGYTKYTVLCIPPQFLYRVWPVIHQSV